MPAESESEEDVPVLGLGWADDPKNQDGGAVRGAQTQYEGGEASEQEVGAQPQEEAPDPPD